MKTQAKLKYEKSCIQLNNEVINRVSSIPSLHLQLVKLCKSLKLSGHNQRNLKELQLKTTSITTRSKNENTKMTYVPPLYKCNSQQYHYSLNVCLLLVCLLKEYLHLLIIRCKI